MADEADSKSVVGNHVWVQVPLPALKSFKKIPKTVDSSSGIFYFTYFSHITCILKTLSYIFSILVCHTIYKIHHFPIQNMP